MAGAHGKDHLLGIEMFEGKAGHLLRRRKTSDDKIEIADAQLLQQHRILAGDDLDAAPGLLLEETAPWPAA